MHKRRDLRLFNIMLVCCVLCKDFNSKDRSLTHHKILVSSQATESWTVLNSQVLSNKSNVFCLNRGTFSAAGSCNTEPLEVVDFRTTVQCTVVLDSNDRLHMYTEVLM